MSQTITVDGWPFDPDNLMTAREVARVFKVDTKTVTRWADAGTLACIRTPGMGVGFGHRRFSRTQVVAIMLGQNGGAR